MGEAKGRRLLGRQVRVNDIFYRGRIGTLIEIVRRDDWEDPWEYVVELSPESEGYFARGFRRHEIELLEDAD